MSTLPPIPLPRFRQNGLSSSPEGNKCLPKSHRLHSHTHCFPLLLCVLASVTSQAFCAAPSLFFSLSLHFHVCLLSLLHMSAYYQGSWWIALNFLALWTTDSSDQKRCVGDRRQVIIPSAAKGVCGHFVDPFWWCVASRNHLGVTHTVAKSTKKDIHTKKILLE